MNGDPRSDAATIAATPLPAWAAGYKLETRSDGRVWLHATVDGCEVYAQPKAWSMMTLKSDVAQHAGADAGPANFGIQLGGLQSHAGRLETNDSSFGQILGAERQVPLPSVQGRDLGPYTAPALILVAGVLVVAILKRLRVGS